MQPAPRPPASVPLGGSLRASRAAQLSLPDGPLSAVDLADGRALTVERLAAGWVVIADLREVEPATEGASPQRATAVAPPTRRGRRLGTGLALAAALGAAIVALATGLSGTPAPAVAGPTPQPVPVQTSVRRQASREPARGGRAAPLPRPKVLPPRLPRPAPVPPPPVVAPAAAPPSPPPPAPVLPELPSAPSL